MTNVVSQLKMKGIRIILYIIIIFITLISCLRSKKQNTTISLISKNDSLHFIQIKTDSTINRWKLPYPVYQFQTGDINNNGDDDILVGVIKSTNFDTIICKRLFIFKNNKGLVRPLWLGSRLGKPLEDFNFVIVNDEARIRSIEIEQDGSYLIAEYRWKSFGLEFIRYINRKIDYKKAIDILNE